MLIELFCLDGNEFLVIFMSYIDCIMYNVYTLYNLYHLPTNTIRLGCCIVGCVYTFNLFIYYLGN